MGPTGVCRGGGCDSSKGNNDEWGESGPGCVCVCVCVFVRVRARVCPPIAQRQMMSWMCVRL